MRLSGNHSCGSQNSLDLWHSVIGFTFHIYDITQDVKRSEPVGMQEILDSPRMLN